MKKLSLKLDDLHVETFATTDGTGEKGTVLGHVSTEWQGCQTEHLYNCTDPHTDEVGCAGSGTLVGVSCASTCFQRICDCTGGMEFTMCDYTCSTCLNECPTDASCMTQDGYQGC